MKRTIMKVTCVKNNCIIKIKIMNEIQHIKTQKNYVVLLFIFIVLFLWNVQDESSNI